MSGAKGGPIPEPVDRYEVEETFHQDAGQQASAQERSSGQPGKRLELPGYEVKDSLGRGAYGEVWLAVQENTGREVAVKVFSRHKGLDWPLLKREVGKLVQVLSERRIVHLLAVGWDADPPYYIMEYVRGGSLAKRLDGKPMPADEAVPLFREVAEALVYLHGKAILHCDLKPANVLLDDRGQVRLADFGQARLSDEEGPPAGTLFYMAPELTDPKARPDVRSDIYSLGAVLYTMLIGRPPYASSTRDLASTGTLSDRLQRYREIVETSPLPEEHQQVAGIDKALAGIIDRCLQRNPAERFANVQQILDALAARERHRAQRPLIALGVLGPAVLLAALFGIGSWAWRATHDNADRMVTKQALDSNLEMARMIAAAMDDRLEGIKRDVSREAKNKALVRLLEAAAGDREARAEEMQQQFQERTEDLQEYYRDQIFYSWFIANRDSYMWARSPREPGLVGRPYSDREWFNGRGNYPQIPPVALVRSEPGLTLVFKSKAKKNPYVFTAASPIQSANGRIIGVLGASVQLDKFNEWLKPADGKPAGGGCPSRFVVLINHRRQLMRHPCVHAETVEIPPEKFLDRPEVQDLLRNRKSSRYRDPLLSGEPYLAAVGPLKRNPGWFVIVEEKLSTAKQPVHELTDQFERLGWSALAVGLAVLAALWVVLFRVIRAAPGRHAAQRVAAAGERS